MIRYVDFTNAFNTISHQKLYRILGDLGFPADAIATIQGIYHDTSTSVIINKTSVLRTAPIHIGRGTIQGDTLSPLMFLLYIEPLLRWLAIGGHGFTPAFSGPNNDTPPAPQSHPTPLITSALTYADDLAVITTCHHRLLHQLKKILENDARVWDAIFSKKKIPFSRRDLKGGNLHW